MYYCAATHAPRADATRAHRRAGVILRRRAANARAIVTRHVVMTIAAGAEMTREVERERERARFLLIIKK
jgi:hypothetical protein